jgi:hypothetical protein
LRADAVKLILTLHSPQEHQEVEMEEVHHTHKEPAWGWAAVLRDWRRSRARARLRNPLQVAAPSTR